MKSDNARIGRDPKDKGGQYYRTGSEYFKSVAGFVKKGEIFSPEDFEKEIGVELDALIPIWPKPNHEGRTMAVFGTASIEKLSNGQFCRWKS